MTGKKEIVGGGRKVGEEGWRKGEGAVRDEGRE